MCKIKTVLLVPRREDLHKLLQEGPCGYRPPTAYISNRGWKWQEGPCKEEFPTRRALALVWNSRVLDRGLDRAISAATSTTKWWQKAPALNDRYWSKEEIANWVAPTLSDMLSCETIILNDE